MRRLVAGEPSFEFLSDIELGTSNLSRKGLSFQTQQTVKKAAEAEDIDLRDDKVNTRFIRIMK